MVAGLFGCFELSVLRLAGGFLGTMIRSGRRIEGRPGLGMRLSREGGLRLGGPALGVIPERGCILRGSLGLRGAPGLDHLAARALGPLLCALRRLQSEAVDAMGRVPSRIP